MREIDVVIVNWNSGRMLRECVLSVIEADNDHAAKIIVVDNGSTDQSLSGLPDDPRLTVIESGENLGFGRACNRGAALATSEYILFLNPDARIFPDTLPKVVALMESEEGANLGVCGIRLIEDDGGTQLHTTAFPTSFNIYQVDRFRTPFDHMSSRRVSHVIGAFYLIRRALFVELGGFDERFFVYFEDLDLSKRVVAAGWGVYYLADATAYHKGGGTSDQIRARRLFYSQLSRIAYAHKHFSRSGAFSVIFVTFTLEPLLRLARAILKGSLSEAEETIRAYRMLWGKSGPLRPPSGKSKP